MLLDQDVGGRLY